MGSGTGIGGGEVFPEIKPANEIDEFGKYLATYDCGGLITKVVSVGTEISRGKNPTATENRRYSNLQIRKSRGFGQEMWGLQFMNGVVVLSYDYDISGYQDTIDEKDLAERVSNFAEEFQEIFDSNPRLQQFRESHFKNLVDAMSYTGVR